MVDRVRVKKILDELGIKRLNRIKEAREEIGITVEDLAKVCGISVGEMSMIENELRIPNQVVIFKTLRGFKKFGVNPHDIFTFY